MWMKGKHWKPPPTTVWIFGRPGGRGWTPADGKRAGRADNLVFHLAGRPQKKWLRESVDSRDEGEASKQAGGSGKKSVVTEVVGLPWIAWWKTAIVTRDIFTASRRRQKVNKQMNQMWNGIVAGRKEFSTTSLTRTSLWLGPAVINKSSKTMHFLHFVAALPWTKKKDCRIQKDGGGLLSLSMEMLNLEGGFLRCRRRVHTQITPKQIFHDSRTTQPNRGQGRVKMLEVQNWNNLSVSVGLNRALFKSVWSLFHPAENQAEGKTAKWTLERPDEPLRGFDQPLDWTRSWRTGWKRGAGKPPEKPSLKASGAAAPVRQKRMEGCEKKNRFFDYFQFWCWQRGRKRAHPHRAAQTTAEQTWPAPSGFQASIWRHFGFKKKIYINHTVNFAMLKQTWEQTWGTILPLSTRSGAKGRKSSSCSEPQNHPKHENKLPMERLRPITKSTGTFIAKDSHPYSVVKNAGFHCLPRCVYMYMYISTYDYRLIMINWVVVLWIGIKFNRQEPRNSRPTRKGTIRHSQQSFPDPLQLNSCVSHREAPREAQRNEGENNSSKCDSINLLSTPPKSHWRAGAGCEKWWKHENAS